METLDGLFTVACYVKVWLLLLEVELMETWESGRYAWELEHIKWLLLLEVELMETT